MRKSIGLWGVLLLSLVSCLNQKSWKEEDITLIPKPFSTTVNRGTFRIFENTRILIPEGDLELERLGNWLSDFLEPATGMKLKVVTLAKGVPHANCIFLQVMDTLKGRDAYTLTASDKRVVINGANYRGVFYGIQSLRQLLPANIESSTKQEEQRWVVPAVEIKDSARFEWRGMHLDVSRHFFTVDELKRFIDYLAFYKINKFHLHLTDDQGWRLEIKKYPLLTQKGAWREHNKQDEQCLGWAKEDATFAIPEDRYTEVDGKRLYGGFYTQEQMKEVIKYATDRFITIIPEIDVPGHFKAAIDNYPYLSCTGKPGWGETFSYPACLGKESTYTFIEDVLSEVADLFPAEYIHIGGDEVNKKSWEKCRSCQREIHKHGLKNEHELQTHFNKRIEEFLLSKGKKLMGWDEIVEGGLTPNSAVMWWRNWAPNAPFHAVDNGSPVIMSPCFQCYFDAWHHNTPLEKTYSYEPVPQAIPVQKSDLIVGVQGNIWTERIPSMDRVEFQSMPRMAALAEVGWASRDLRNWDDFTARVRRHYPRLEQMGVFYHLPPLEGLEKETVFIDKALVDIQIPLKDMEVYYTLDGSTPTKEGKRYSQPFYLEESAKVRMRSYRGVVFSEIFEGTFSKQAPRKAEDVSNLTSGIQRQYQKGRFGKVEELPKKLTGKVNIVGKVDLGEYQGQEMYGLLFKGYVKVPQTGVYTFISSSDDGDQVFIGDKLVVNNGGSHAANRKVGMIALEKGLHPIFIKYRQLGGGSALILKIQGPGVEEQELGEGTLFYKNNN